MSQENVETVKRALEAYNRFDVEALLEEVATDVEWYPALQVSIGGDAAVFRGHEGVRELFRDIRETLSEIHAEFSDIRDRDEQVVVIGRIRLRGKESGAETESPLGLIADMKHGKVTRVRSYLDPDEALEAVGLSEWAMSRENVEIVRTGCEAWLRGDLDAMFETWHRRVEWDTTHFEGWVESHVYRGQEEVRRFLEEEWLASWDPETYEASFELLDKGDQVVALWSQRMAGRGSGAPVKLDSAQILTLQDGKVSRIDNYTDQDEALKAVGLRE